MNNRFLAMTCCLLPVISCALTLPAWAAAGSTDNEKQDLPIPSPLHSLPPGATHDMICGPECLWIVAHYFGKDVSLAELIDMTGCTPDAGTTVDSMVSCARKIGLCADVTDADLPDVLSSGRLAILLVRGNGHFVVLLGADSDHVDFLDGSSRHAMKRTDFQKYWSHLSILVGATTPASAPRLSAAAAWIICAGVALLILAFGAIRLRRYPPGTHICR